MLSHFGKLNSPIQPVLDYQKPQDQKRRFMNLGWRSCNVKLLWELWQDAQFLPVAEKLQLDSVEPFDEWEELALFAQHYFVALADMTVEQQENQSLPEEQRTSQQVSTSFEPQSAISSHKRFAASFQMPESIGLFGGHGAQGRTATGDVYVPTGEAATRPAFPASADVMCHTITTFEPNTSLLVGGRTSPDNALAACFLQSDTTWKRVDDIPHGRFRHCTARTLDDSSSHGVVVFGGKSDSTQVLGDWLAWTPAQQWRQLHVAGRGPCARFGAYMCSFGSSGFLGGGMSAEGDILDDFWAWRVSGPEVVCEQLSPKFKKSATHKIFGRFGAQAVTVRDAIYLVGGVSSSYVTKNDEILVIDKDLNVSSLSLASADPQPLLVGHCVEAVEARGAAQLVVPAGGAVCFSFGTFWNAGVWTLALDAAGAGPAWRMLARTKAVEPARAAVEASAMPLSSPRIGSPRYAARTTLADAGAFDDLLRASQPAILEGLDFGPCTRKWNLDYLVEQIGPSRMVVIHDSPTPAMDFLRKNFDYTTVAFGDFVARLVRGDHVYLRALSAAAPADAPAQLADDFAAIAGDFALPPELARVRAAMHSSPLRVSGRATMWLHYDVMANILVQVTGSKRLVLFAPRHAPALGFAAGASSSQVQVFDEAGRVRDFAAAYEPIVCDLAPGDALFLPPLWLHTAHPSDGVSVAVNVFFRSLDAGYAAGRDVYGNRDLQAYETGRRDVQRIVKAFRPLPAQPSAFYLRRLAAELLDAAEAAEGSVGG